MRKIHFNANVGGKGEQELRSGIVRFSKNLESIFEEGMRAFAVEVRRRARISLARTKGAYPSGSDTRYPRALRDSIEFEVDRKGRDVTFTVGEGLPYARLQNDTGRTYIYGNPEMRFFWYQIQRPMRVRRPGYVVRYGTGFFNKALTNSLRDFDKIFGRVWAKATKESK